MVFMTEMAVFQNVVLDNVLLTWPMCSVVLMLLIMFLMHLHFSVTSPADLIQLYLVRCDNQMEVTTIES
jgi:hypothetical protein